MLKIRDLGVNVIPATMRPPEIGPGGGMVASDTCGDETCGDTCDPSGQCVPSCDNASAAPRHSGFSSSAIAQLRRQLREQLT